VLFGSYYKGKPHKDSDIDIAVVSNDFKYRSISHRGRLTYDAEVAVIRKFDIPIDLIKLTVDEYENETRMIASYIKEGKVVYSSN
jgi:predicted nucleotidyltransferase